jgi:predicted nucleotidyltransferase
MKSASTDIRKDLIDLPSRLFVSRWLLERVPFVFAEDFDAYLAWKHDLGDRLDVDPRAICLVGSAASGFSLSPQRAFQVFGERSDIDVAVVSAQHFDMVWRWLRSLGAERYRLPQYVQAQIDDHRERLVYWGAIATDKFLQYTPLGKAWVPALAEAAQRLPNAAHDVNVRLFREFETLRTYQAHCCDKIRDKL